VWPGVLVDVAYTSESLSNVRGGVRTGTTYLGNLDLTAQLHLGELVGWRGTTLFLYGLGNHGGTPSADVGDAQGVSNIEAPSTFRLYEAWLEQDVREERLSLLVGLYDLNSEFDVLPGASLFLNSSFGTGAELAASGVAGPSIFPVAGLGVRAKWRPGPGLYLQGALLDGVPGDPDDPGATAVRLSGRDGALVALEAGWLIWGEGGGPEDRDPAPHRTHGPVGRRVSAEGLRGKVAFGVWSYTRRFEVLDPKRQGERLRGRPGAYLLAEWRNERGKEGAVTISGRVGVADPRVHPFLSYTGLSAVVRGLVPGRPSDELGGGIAAAHWGGGARAAGSPAGTRLERTESVVELTYRIQGEGWALQPDLQYVLDPGGDPSLRDALVLGVRFELSPF